MSTDNLDMQSERSDKPKSASQPSLEVPSNQKIDHQAGNDSDDNLSYDSGITAWLQVLGSVILFFNTFGVMNSWGEFQKYYESEQLFTASSSEISCIGSSQSCLTLVIGALTGTIYDAGYLRLLLVIGTIGTTLGLMMLSLCKKYWQVVLTQGITMGLGIGCLYLPAIAVLPGYFKKKIGLAIGIATFGSSVGGIIYPLMFHGESTSRTEGDTRID